MPRARSIAPPSSAVALAEEEAPKGRNIPAQGIALGSRPPTNPSPEGAAQEFSTDESPQGWRETTFGELIRSVSINDKKLPAKQYAESGKFPVVDQGQKFIGGYSDDENRVISDELPLIVFGDHTRIFKYLDRAFVPGADGIKVLKPIGVDAKWLFHIAHALDFPDKGYARHFQHLKQATVFVPPLHEQRRIVARIEELFSRLDAGVAALRHAKAQLQRYRQAVLAAAVTGQLTQEWREQHPDTEPASALLERILEQRRDQWDGKGKYKKPQPITPETCELSLCTPENWALVSMEMLIEAPQYGTSKKCSYEIEGSSVLRIPNVINGFVDSADLKFAKFDDSEIVNYSLRENDLLMVRSNGSLSIVGKTALVRSQDQHHLYAGYLIRLRPIASSVAGRFLSLALAAPPLRAQIESKAKSTSGVNNINAKEIQSLVLQLPPLAEQHQIVAEVEARTTAIEHLEAELSRQITRSNRLRQSILGAAFKGEL